MAFANTGTPSSGPRSPPRARRASDARASSSALSASRSIACSVVFQARARRNASPVLSANYLRKQVEDDLEMPHEGPCMHEFVASAHNLAPDGVRALDVAKALLDRDFYAPTVYFPLVVPEAIMVEPTETESKATLDAFAAAIKEIVAEAKSNPQALHDAPLRMPVGRLDEVAAARKINSYLQGQSDDPVLRWKPAAK